MLGQYRQSQQPLCYIGSNLLSHMFWLTYKRAIIRQLDTNGKLYMCYTLSSFGIICNKISVCISYYIYAHIHVHIIHKVTVKCTLVQALRLCTSCTAHRGRRGIALPFLDHGTRRVWGVSITPRPLFTPGKDPVPIVQEAGWAPALVWTGAENLAPTGIRSLDCPARSQSLYQLSYI
jgi:hypothetical protein